MREEVKNWLAQAMLYSLLIAGTLTAGCSAAENSSSANNTKPGITAKAKPPEEISELTEAEISKYMAMPTVDDILVEDYNAGRITQVKYDSRKGTTDFDALVFQEHLKAGDRKPVLAMISATATDSSKREAVIFKELAKRYEGQIEFVIYTQGTEPNLTPKDIEAKYGIKGAPSIIMYSPFDLVNGETPENNNGKIKQIDILRGGPKNNLQIPNWIRDFPVWWINPNLFCKATPDKDGLLYRFMNTGDYKKVDNFKYTPIN